MTPEEIKEVAGQIADAVRQGLMVREKMRGDKAGGADLSNVLQERNTNWRDPLREFIQQTCDGDDLSRFVPPNKRLLASGFIMPSHFSESVGELIVACDTSGSMGGVYPIVFGEIARICNHAMPSQVRVIWWDTQVAGEQVFKPGDYERMGTVMKPAGGGGTTVSCVAAYVREKKYTPAAVIYLTDGYIESNYDVVDAPCLWGVIDNDSFMPLKGKLLRLYSDAM